MKWYEGAIILMAGIILYLSLILNSTSRELKNLELLHNQAIIECSQALLRIPVKQ